MLEQSRLLNSVTQPMPVLYMTSIVTDPGVENIIEGIFSQKEITQHTHTFGMVVVKPHTPQVSDSVNNAFLLPQLKSELLVIDIVVRED